jgi:hypothetical protein
MALEGVKKHCSGSDVSERVKERAEARDQVGRGMVFLGGVGWVDFAGTKGEGLGVDQVYPGQGVEGVEFVTSRGEGTCTPGLVAYREDNSIRNVQGEGSQQEEAQGGQNEGEQTVSDSTSQVEFQRWRGYLVWAVVYYQLQHPHSSRSPDSSAAGMRVIGVSV